MENIPQSIQFSIGNTEFTLLLHENVQAEYNGYYSEVHFHAFHELLLLFEGKVYVDTDASMGTAMTAPSGCVFPPRIYHRVHSPAEERFRHIFLRFFFKRLPDSHEAFDSYSLYKRIFARSEPLLFSPSENLFSGFWDTLREVAAGQAADKPALQSVQIANMVSLLFVKLAAQECSDPRQAAAPCREYDKSTEYYLRFARMELVLENHILQGENEGNLEEELFLSSKQICRIVELEYGDNYRNYVRNYRMKRAEFLLKHNEYSVEQIAEIVGYNSVSSFSATFKKVYHASPLEYRKRFAHKG